jgi:hypothetical protein
MAPIRHVISHTISTLPRMSIALACAMMIGTPISLAQESGLRGTVKEPVVEVGPLVKKKKKKLSRLEAATASAPVPVARYEPADLDPETDRKKSEENNADRAAAPTSNPPASNEPALGASSLASSREPARSQVRAAPANNGDPAVDRQTTGEVLREGEVPTPVTAEPSTGSLERNDTARATRDNTRQAPIEGLDKTAETDPYAAPGIVAGAFTLRPTFEQGMRWTNNSDDSATGSEALISETNVKLRAESNWLRHRLNLEANGAFRKSVSGQSVSNPAFGLAAELRLDASTSATVNASASWDRSKESATAPALMTGPFTRPTLDTMRASLGATYDPGLFGVTATGQVTRQAYGDAANSSGVAVSQEDRNNTFASLTLRGSYDLSPVLTPFLEVEGGRRFYDNTLDSYGRARSAYRYGVRAGLAANLGEKLSGELAAGWLKEDIDDTALADVSGLDLRGTVNWSPHRGTNVAFSLATTVEGSTLSASSGSILYGANARLTHQIRDNLEANLALGAGVRIYEKGAYQDTIFSSEAGLTWWMNRYAGINGRVRHERTLNLDPARAFDSTSVYLGVTLRR